jgi:hypothetical protein
MHIVAGDLIFIPTPQIHPVYLALVGAYELDIASQRIYFSIRFSLHYNVCRVIGRSQFLDFTSAVRCILGLQNTVTDKQSKVRQRWPPITGSCNPFSA